MSGPSPQYNYIYSRLVSDETSLCEAGRFVYIMLIGVDISERF